MGCFVFGFSEIEHGFTAGILFVFCHLMFFFWGFGEEGVVVSLGLCQASPTGINLYSGIPVHPSPPYTPTSPLPPLTTSTKPKPSQINHPTSTSPLLPLSFFSSLLSGTPSPPITHIISNPLNPIMPLRSLFTKSFNKKDERRLQHQVGKQLGGGRGEGGRARGGRGRGGRGQSGRAQGGQA